MTDEKTPRQTLIAHTVSHLVDNRKTAAEALGMSKIGLRYLDPDDPDGDALHIHEAIEEVAPDLPTAVRHYLDDISPRAWRRLVCAVARRFNERMDKKRRARIARRRLHDGQRLADR